MTWEAGDAIWMAAAAVKEGVEVLVAAGGDGTLNEVLNGLPQLPSKGLVLGMVPMGTANDFAESCRIPEEPDEALRMCLEPPVPVDLIRVADRRYVNMATGGYGTRATAEAPEELKRILGGLSYLFIGLSRAADLQVNEGRFKTEKQEWEGSFYALAVGNGKCAGGGVELCPDARIDDGILDVCIFKEIPRELRLPRLGQLLTEGIGALERDLVRLQAPELEVELSSTLQLNLDGEPTERRSFRFEVEPAALSMALPPDCELLSQPESGL